jgi:hypothetical protein
MTVETEIAAIWRQRLEQAAARYRDRIPAGTLQGICEYVLHLRPQGGFLTNVFANDLFRAVGQADRANKVALPDICEFIWNFCPEGCWGSPEAVHDWLSQRKGGAG